MPKGVVIRPYRDADERGWVICRALSFLDTAFFDDVRPRKERYEGEAIELVAERDGQIVGLIDVECESEPGTICEDRPGLGGMIWHLAVHPDHQRRGIATALLREAEQTAGARGVERFEAWTRDDDGTRRGPRKEAVRIRKHRHSLLYERLKLATAREQAGVFSGGP